MSLELSTDGGLIVDKPSGPTSHDVVAIARRALRERRIGHTGTLDPLATGVLVLLVGRATRLSQFLLSDEKEYIADVRLGVSTPTYDAASLGDPRCDARGARGVGRGAMDGDINEVVSRFRGTFLQVPPQHSAKKVAGVRAYESARHNTPVELQPVEVTVHELEIIAPVAATTSHATRTSPLASPASDSRAQHFEDRTSDSDTLLRLRIVCSSGFYVRSLAHDLGQALGCGAHLEALRRTRAGQFSIGEALPLEVLATDPDGARLAVRPMNAMLAQYAAVTLSAEGARRAAHGNLVRPEHLVEPGGPAIEARRVRLLDPSGALLAIAERRPDLALHPLAVLV